MASGKGIIFVAIIGGIVGFYGMRLYRKWQRWRRRNWLVVPGDRITIESSSGKETMTVKKVKHSTITLDN